MQFSVWSSSIHVAFTTALEIPVHILNCVPKGRIVFNCTRLELWKSHELIYCLCSTHILRGNIRTNKQEPEPISETCHSIPIRFYSEFPKCNCPFSSQTTQPMDRLLTKTAQRNTSLTNELIEQDFPFEISGHNILLKPSYTPSIVSFYAFMIVLSTWGV